MKRTALIVFSMVLVGLTACETIDRPTANDRSFGTVDPTVFVSVGNSLTAGYQSGALFESAQQYSMPLQMAKHFGVDFVQPLFPDPGTGQLITLKTLTTTGADLVMGEKTMVAPSNVTYAKPYNNLGIPGAILYDFTDETEFGQKSVQRGNPFFASILRNQTAFGVSVLQQAVNLNPTLMTFWYGANDVLGYAASGGTTGTNAPLYDRPTDPQVFEILMTQALQSISMKLPDTKVLVANIPNILFAPYFVSDVKTVQHPTDPNVRLKIWFKTSFGTTASLGDDDYLLLPALSQLKLGIGLSPTAPLGSEYVLDVDEVTITLDAITKYNAAIFKLVNSAALRANFKLVDMYALFDDIHSNQFRMAGETYSTKLITGGVFSLDGLHPEPRGNAILANEFIKTMNTEFGANLPMIPLNNLPGVLAPTNALGKRHFDATGVRTASGMFDGALLRF